MYLNYEMFDGEYNIHITTPDSFEDKLRKHDIHCLECIYAPKEAKLMITTDYLAEFQLHNFQLKKMIMSQSTAAWNKARRRIEQGNIIGGAKSLFHALRILRFGLQIVQHGTIINFKDCNRLWQKVNDFQGIEWYEYEEQWLQVKKQYMKEFRKSYNTPELSVVNEAFEKIDSEKLESAICSE